MVRLPCESVIVARIVVVTMVTRFNFVVFPSSCRDVQDLRTHSLRRVSVEKTVRQGLQGRRFRAGPQKPRKIPAAPNERCRPPLPPLSSRTLQLAGPC